MTERIPVKKKKYAIAVIHPDGVVGWLTKASGGTETYSSRIAAERGLEARLLDTRYTWTLPMEIRIYDEDKI